MIQSTLLHSVELSKGVSCGLMIHTPLTPRKFHSFRYTAMAVVVFPHLSSKHLIFGRPRALQSTRRFCSRTYIYTYISAESDGFGFPHAWLCLAFEKT